MSYCQHHDYVVTSTLLLLSPLRYVGDSYSNMQEVMEDSMLSFYTQSSAPRPLSKPVVGQLVAVLGEDRDELARAQLSEVLGPDKVKVRLRVQMLYVG